MFNIGDLVVWASSSYAGRAKIGAVVHVIPNDQNLSDFAIYDVQFDDVLHTLHGSELRHYSLDSVPCNEKQRLRFAYQKAIENYRQAVNLLADAAGNMAHTEFEFVNRRVKALRRFAHEAQELLRSTPLNITANPVLYCLATTAQSVAVDSIVIS